MYHSYEITIPEELAGQRIDAALASLLPEHSRARITEWIKDEQVSVDEAYWKPKDRVEGGEVVLIEAEMAQAVSFEPEDIPLSIIYEDEHVLVIDKPVGLVVHPGAGNYNGTLLNAVLYHAPQCLELPRAGIVHRLDKDTSGIMVVAKTLVAHTHLVRQLQARTMKRFYKALVFGDLVVPGTVDAPIGRHRSARTKMAVTSAGKEARTHYRILKRFDGVCTLLECQLDSGRTHQIRVHCSHIGHPIVGDDTYNPRQNIPRCSPELRAILRGFERQALHAVTLNFEHPATNERLTFHSPLTQDLVSLLAAVESNTWTG